MSRKPIIDDMVFRKTYNSDNLRQVIHAFAIDGERVGDLIDRAVAAGLAPRKQVRAAIYLGARAENALFRLEKKE